MISFLNPGAGNLTSVHLASLAATPATARKAFFALDFDGVICDSAAETGASAWKAAERFWPGRFPSRRRQNTSGLPSSQAVPGNRLSGHTDHKNAHDGLPPEAMATGFNERVNAIMAEIGQNKSAMVHAFGDTRDQWIKADLDDWISWHGIYPGVLEALQKVLDDGQHLRILTTKQERFVSAILSAHGVDFPADHIWGLERRESKEDQLARLLADGDNDVYFIEDRLETLLRVEARDDLRAVRLYWAPGPWHSRPPRLPATTTASSCFPKVSPVL